MTASREALPEPTEVLGALWRGARRRCPRCGGGNLFSSWLRMRPACGACGLALDRGEEDHFLGAYVMNLVIAEAVPAIVVLGAVFLTWPDVPWTGLAWIAVSLAVVCPFLFYPFSRTLWLAVDSTFRREAGGEATRS